MPTRKRDAEKTKERLFKAAEEIFVQKGYDAARVDEIAKKAKTNKRLIYVYFGNKEDIYLEVLKVNLSRILETSGEALDENMDPREATKQVIRRLFTFLADNRGVVRLINWESLSFHQSKKRNRELAKILSAGLHRMETVVEQGKSQGLFRKDLDVKQLVLSVASFCMTYFQRRLLREAIWNEDLSDPVIRERALNHINELVFHGISVRTNQNEPIEKKRTDGEFV